MNAGGTATSVLADRDDQYVLVIVLGSGGPKVGLVSLIGRVVHQEHQLLDQT